MSRRCWCRWPLGANGSPCRRQKQWYNHRFDVDAHPPLPPHREHIRNTCKKCKYNLNYYKFKRRGGGDYGVGGEVYVQVVLCNYFPFSVETFQKLTIQTFDNLRFSSPTHPHPENAEKMGSPHQKNTGILFWPLLRIRIRRIRMFLVLLNPDPDILDVWIRFRLLIHILISSSKNSNKPRFLRFLTSFSF
jgi:hypothetical protein